MKAMRIDGYGKNVKLRLAADTPVPNCGPKDVLVRIHAASVNPIDFKIRDGAVRLVLPYRPPLTLGNDFSGTIEAVGAEAGPWKVGDEVYGRPDKSRIGTFAEFLAISKDEIARKPANTTFEEAAGLPLVGLTSWQALLDCARLEKGQKVLIHAGAGGVGCFAIQLAKWKGAHVATTASDRGAALVKSLGADEIINYRSEDFSERLRDFDVVFDTLGGESLEKSFRVLKCGGHIVSVSGSPDFRYARASHRGPLLTALFSLVGAKLSFLSWKHGVTYTFLFMRPDGNELSRITELVEAGTIRPVIDRVFPLERAQEALDFVESGRAKGKVVIKVG